MPDGNIRGGVIGLVQVCPDLVSLIDPVTGLYPYQLACAGEATDLDSSYRLLRACPTALTNTAYPAGRREERSFIFSFFLFY